MNKTDVSILVLFLSLPLAHARALSLSLSIISWVSLTFIRGALISFIAHLNPFKYIKLFKPIKFI